MRARPVTLKEAQAFVGELHRHHKAPVGHRFSIGCEQAGNLVGVATIGRPVAPKTEQYKIAEVTRLCTDGSKNACSFLYALAARICRDMGFTRIQTFILPTESGVSLRAAGWVFDGESNDAGKKGWQSRAKRRTDQPAMRKHRYIKRLNEE